MEEQLPRTRTDRDRTFAQCILPEVETLLRVATTLTARPDHAEELVRDTLRRAYETCDRYDGHQPRAWLLTLMRQARTDRQNTAGSPAFHAVVDNALAALPLTYRQVIRLVDIDGLSYAETAGLLGVSEAFVTSRLRRARRRILLQLKAAGLVPGRGER